MLTVLIQVPLVLPVLLQVLVVRGSARNSVVAIKRINLEEADEATTEW